MDGLFVNVTICHDVVVIVQLECPVPDSSLFLFRSFQGSQCVSGTRALQQDSLAVYGPICWSGAFQFCDPLSAHHVLVLN